MCHENSHFMMYNQWVSVLLRAVGISSAFLIKCLAVSKQLWGRSVISADAVCLSSSCLHKWTYGLLAQGQLTQLLIRYNFSLFDVSDTKICPLAGMPFWYRNFVSLWIDSSVRKSKKFACDHGNICLLQMQIQPCKYTWTCQWVSSCSP